jgi:hypothetical protein
MLLALIYTHPLGFIVVRYIVWPAFIGFAIGSMIGKLFVALRFL